MVYAQIITVWRDERGEVTSRAAQAIDWPDWKAFADWCVRIGGEAGGASIEQMAILQMP